MPASPLPLAGELAALGAASCWAISALAHERAGGRVGALSLNILRLFIGLGLLAGWNAIDLGEPWPQAASPEQWQLLAGSAFIGLLIGDYCLFRAIIAIGPRLSSLLMSATPIWTALIAWIWLKEAPTAQQTLGILAVVVGIAGTLSERSSTAPAKDEDADEGEDSEHSGDGLAFGIFLGLMGSLGQAGGLVLSKLGTLELAPFAATQIRVFAALIGFAIVVTALRWWPKVWSAARDPMAMRAIWIGSIFGPFLGIGFSLVSVKYAPAGIAAALMATTPLILIPVERWRGRPVGWRSWLGTAIAVGGVALLVL